MQKSRENYRLLSILSIPSKLAEGQICSIVDKHKDSSGIAHPNQCGYKQGRSTQGILLHLTEKWNQAINEGLYVAILFIDFQKASDGVQEVSKKFFDARLNTRK